jgi:hypothetical protein
MPGDKTPQYLTVPRQRLDSLSGVLTESLGALAEAMDSGLPPALDALEDASHTLEARPGADELSQIIALQIRRGEQKMKDTRESAVRVIALLGQAQKDLARLTGRS